MNKKILITGAAGMIGSTVVESKLKKNNLVYGIDNFLNKKSIYIKKFLTNKNFFFKKKDISLSKKIFRNNLYFDEVWLLAANSDIRAGIKNPNVDYQNTFLSTYNFLNNINKNLKKNTKIIFTSSSAIYGDLKNKKIKLNYGPYKPISNYGAMKSASESYLTYYCQNYSIPFYIFRFLLLSYFFEKKIKAFSEIVTPIISQCDLLRIQNRKLKGARDILLPRLMNQTIKV